MAEIECVEYHDDCDYGRAWHRRQTSAQYAREEHNCEIVARLERLVAVAGQEDARHGDENGAAVRL